MTDVQLVEAATEMREGIIGQQRSDRFCFMVSLPLEGYLSAMGVDARLVRANFPKINHCWLSLPDGRILDPTADQFGLPSVYLGPMPAKYRRWMRAHARFVERASEALHATR